MITVNGLNISDNVNYLVESITYRNAPDRTIVSQPISTRPGDKFITTEWRAKTITIAGKIFTTTISGLRPFVDQLQQNFAVESTNLLVTTDRTYTVNLSKLDIPNQFFQNSVVDYTAEFKAIDPFAYGSQLTISGIVAPGITTFSGSVTISGTVFAEPTLSLLPTNGGVLAGNSGYSQVQVTYRTTNEIITISGMNSGNFQYGVQSVIDYKNFAVTLSGVGQDYTGVFSRFEPGLRAFNIAITSGTPNGYQWVLAYQPRYLE